MNPLPDYSEALALALRDIKPVGRPEQVELAHAGGRALASPVIADRDLPPFNRAQMDGYAMRAAEFKVGKAWPVVGMIPAGAAANVRVPPGSCVAIATGAPLPDEVDTVVQHEWSDRGDRSGRAVHFTIDSIEKAHAVHPRGADARAGDTMIEPGTLLGAQHLGIAAAVGLTSVEVRARPQAVVLTSGDEVVPIGAATASHQIRNSNGPMIHELLLRFGAEPGAMKHLPDEREATMAAVREAVDRFDLVITVGGVSAGDRDHFPAAFDACGVVRSLTGAAIQPGRPIVVGLTPQGAVIIGLPGNPVSALACACLFAWPIVCTMLGMNAQLPWRDAELAQPVKPNAQRRAFRPAILQDDGRVTVPSWAGSGDLAHTSPTHGLAELPVRKEQVPAGERVRFLPWP